MIVGDDRYLAQNELQNMYAYFVESRSSHVGIWFKEKEAFILYRWGYGGTLTLMLEKHWDEQPVYIAQHWKGQKKWLTGTVKPIYEIEQSPFFAQCTTKLTTLTKQIIEYLRFLSFLYPEEELYKQYLVNRNISVGSGISEKTLIKKKLYKKLQNEDRIIYEYWQRRKSRIINKTRIYTKFQSS